MTQTGQRSRISIVSLLPPRSVKYERFLFLFQDYNDDIRQEQMWEMQVLSSQRNNNKGDEGTSGGGPQPGVEYTTASAPEDRLSETMPDSPEDEHPALRGVQPGNLIWQRVSMGDPRGCVIYRAFCVIQQQGNEYE